MARRVSKKMGKKRSKRVYRRRARVARKGEYAACVQNIELTVMPDLANPGTTKPLAAGQVNVMTNFTLRACDRAVQIARAYQYYRINKIEMIVKPNFDTYSTNNVFPSGSVPYLYYLIDKGYNINNISDFNSMRDAGAKPFRFDEKMKRIAWKPAVRVGLADVGNTNSTPAGTLFAMAKTSPWLATNQNVQTPIPGSNPATAWQPSSVDHSGVIIGLEQYQPPGAVPSTYQITCRVYFEFKKPNTAINQTEPAEVAILNIETLRS